MDLQQALRELSAALETAGGREARLRAARQVLVDRSLAALGIEAPAHSSLDTAIRLTLDASSKPARRICAVLMVHALAVPGLLPPAALDDVRTLIESALRDVLLRCGYPFAGSAEEKLRVLRRLPASLSELMQPLEPTFPNWQGLYAG